jgi:hypothetical protein
MRAALFSLILCCSFAHAKDVLVAKCGPYGIFDSVYGKSHNILISDGSDEIQMRGENAKALDGESFSGGKFHLEMRDGSVVLSETSANKPQRKLICERINSDAVKAALNAAVFGPPTAATVSSEPDWSGQDQDDSGTGVEISGFGNASH